MEKILTIERYLRGDMSPEEKQKFEAQRNVDRQFDQETEDYSQLFQGFDALHAEQMLSQLKHFEAEKKQVEPVLALQEPIRFKSRTPTLSYAIAAVILALVVPVGFGLFLASDRSTNFENQFAENVAQTIGELNLRGAQSADEVLALGHCDLGLQSLTELHYDEAISLLNQATKDLDNGQEKQFLTQLGLGMAYTGKLDKQSALDAFAKAKNLASSPEQNHAVEWQEAWALLRLNEGKESKMMLEAIVRDSGHTYKRPALKLLQSL